jgi:hypothetical protein
MPLCLQRNYAEQKANYGELGVDSTILFAVTKYLTTFLTAHSVRTGHFYFMQIDK